MILQLKWNTWSPCLLFGMGRWFIARCDVSIKSVFISTESHSSWLIQIQILKPEAWTEKHWAVCFNTIYLRDRYQHYLIQILISIWKVTLDEQILKWSVHLYCSTLFFVTNIRDLLRCHISKTQVIKWNKVWNAFVGCFLFNWCKIKPFLESLRKVDAARLSKSSQRQTKVSLGSTNLSFPN